MNNTRFARLTQTVRNGISRRSVASVLALTGTALMLLMPGLAAACDYCDDRFDDQTLDCQSSTCHATTATSDPAPRRRQVSTATATG